MTRNKGKKTKSILHTHFIKRLNERYSSTTNGDEIRRAIRQINGGKSRFLSRLSNRVSNHVVDMEVTDLVTMERKTIPVAVGYDSQRKALTTALPPTVLESSQDENLAP